MDECVGRAFVRGHAGKRRADPVHRADDVGRVRLLNLPFGLTRRPKAVRHVHTSLMATARLMGQGIIGIREDDVAFSAAKLSFSYGLGNAISFPMSVGA